MCMFVLKTVLGNIYWLNLLKAKPDDALDLSRILNDDIAETVQKHPKRFVGLGTVPMQAPELAAVEMKRCKHDLGNLQI